MEKTFKSKKLPLALCPPAQLSAARKQALDTLVQIDVPAKGRIAYHIRMGRLQRALELCQEGRVSILKRFAVSAASAALSLDQLQLWGRLELLLRSEVARLHHPILKGSF